MMKRLLSEFTRISGIVKGAGREMGGAREREKKMNRHQRKKITICVYMLHSSNVFD